ncbi:MAG: hypothetical protein U5L09_01710 [Bacteroidales bacterium]|nr:hypothetical protein [Bacteroidales bacterium]
MKSVPTWTSHTPRRCLIFTKVSRRLSLSHPDKEVEKYHQSLANPITTKKIGVWKKQLPEKEVKKADAVVGRYAELSGYHRKYTDAGILQQLKLLPGIIYRTGVISLC